MNQHRLSRIIFTAFVLSSLAQARGWANPLTFTECVELAVRKNEKLSAQRSRMSQAAERIGQYRGNILPQISYNYVKTYRDTAGGLYSTDLNDAKFVLAQPLFRGLRDFKAYGQAKAQANREIYAYESAARELRSQAAEAFYALVLIDADIASVREVEKILDGRLSELKQRVRLGKSRESDILMVESQISGFRAQEEAAYGARESAAENLSFLTGMAASDMNVRDDSLPGEGIGPLEAYLENSGHIPEIRLAEADIEIQKYGIALARGAHLPTLDLLGDWYIHRSGTSLTDSSWDALLTFNFPLFQGGSAQAKVREETYRLAEFEDRLALARREAERGIRILYRRAVSSIKQSEAYRDAYAKAARSYDMQLKDYGYGLVNNLDVLQSMNAMLEAKRSFDRAQVQAKLDKILLDIAVNKR